MERIQRSEKTMQKITIIVPKWQKFVSRLFGIWTFVGYLMDSFFAFSNGDSSYICNSQFPWADTNFSSVVIYKALCFDVAQGRMNGASNETRIHSCRLASLAC